MESPEVATKSDCNCKSDASLLRRYRHGDETAATELYRRYAARLHSVAKGNCGRELSVRVDSDDILQSVFRSFFRRVANGHYDISNEMELWKLLLVITLNKVRACGAHHRAAKRNVRSTTTDTYHFSAGKRDDVSDALALLDLQLLIAEIQGKLPPVQQQMIQLRLEGYEIAEIAAKTSRSKRTVERVLHDFRNCLKKELSEDASQ